MFFNSLTEKSDWVLRMSFIDTIYRCSSASSYSRSLLESSRIISRWTLVRNISIDGSRVPRAYHLARQSSQRHSRIYARHGPVSSDSSGSSLTRGRRRRVLSIGCSRFRGEKRRRKYNRSTRARKETSFSFSFFLFLFYGNGNGVVFVPIRSRSRVLSDRGKSRSHVRLIPSPRYIRRERANIISRRARRSHAHSRDRCSSIPRSQIHAVISDYLDLPEYTRGDFQRFNGIDIFSLDVSNYSVFIIYLRKEHLVICIMCIYI